MEENGLKNWQDYFRRWPDDPNEPEREWKWDLPEKFHYTTWTGERTIAQINEAVSKDKPFFIWSSFHDPHPPYLVPEPWASMYNPDDMVPGTLANGEMELLPPHFLKTQEKNPDFSMYEETGYYVHGFHSHLIDDKTLKKRVATYYGMISFVDFQIGKIMEALDKTGQRENTIVLFTTDHGYFLGQHGLIEKGAFHFEDMVKIPMIASYPGKVPTGVTNKALQSQVDFVPTFLSMADVKIPGKMQGVDQSKVWYGGLTEARKNVIVENRHEPTTVHLRTYIDERYKITVYRDKDYGELFDLEKDPMEKNNLWNNPNASNLKCVLLQKFLNAELEREFTPMPRIANA
jgi:uncharacterized sulfatase